jgi:hypothetical protein
VLSANRNLSPHGPAVSFSFLFACESAARTDSKGPPRSDVPSRWASPRSVHPLQLRPRRGLTLHENAGALYQTSEPASDSPAVRQGMPRVRGGTSRWLLRAGPLFVVTDEGMQEASAQAVDRPMLKPAIPSLFLHAEILASARFLSKSRSLHPQNRSLRYLRIPFRNFS